LVKLGILGASKIVPQAILEPAKKISELQIAAIASSDFARGQDFASVHGIPKAYETYQALLDDDRINAVYIALSNDLHAEWIVKAANAKKHVLIEKPICLTQYDFDKIKYAITANNVILHEAIMVRHHPWQSKIKELIHTNAFGAVKKLATNFTYTLSATRHNSYRFFPERGGGSFYDNSPYWIQFLQTCFQVEPVAVEASSDFNGPNGVDMNFKTSLQYPEGIQADFFSSYEHPYDATHWIEFEQAKLKIRNFFRPSYGYQKLIVAIEKPTGSDRIIFEPENYYFNQLMFFVDLLNGKLSPEPLNQLGARVMLTERIYNTAINKFNANRIAS
jgi:predicted dehydrogenase